MTYAGLKPARVCMLLVDLSRELSCACYLVAEGAHKSFMRGAFKITKAEMKGSKDEGGESSGCNPTANFENALIRALGKKEDVAQIDMEQELKNLNLYDLFPSSQWPPHAPVSVTADR